MKIPLTQGAYEARGVSANVQRQINLFFEPNTQDAPFPGTIYPTPGLKLLADYTGTISGRCRGLYWSSALELFAVFGSTFLRVNGDFTAHIIGTINADNGYPVSMADNGTYVFIVDGSGGWTYDMYSNAFAACTDPSFSSSTRVDFIDTFFIFSKTNTQQWYISNPNDITFNSLYFVNKEGYSDIVVSIAALHDIIWVFGQVTTELWFNSGAADFPFQRMPQGILQQGCFSSYSIVVADNAVYWISQDRHGHLMMMRGEGYSAKRVSNFAVEQAWGQFDLSAGAIYSMVYQHAGHEFIVVQFTNVGQTWVYDATTGFWHQRQTSGGAWLPSAISYWKQGAYTFGGAAAVANMVVAGDSGAARLYEIDDNTFTDNGQPITRIRGYPHILNDQKRLLHNQFVAAMRGGNLTPDTLSLVWSDDAGQTWNTPVAQTTNGASNGQYSWRRLGMVRDRVYEISWTSTGQTALSGAWLEATPADT